MVETEPLDVKSYQNSIAELLARFYPQDSIEVEWSAMQGERGVYSPRVDVAVGPYAVRNDQQFGQEYDSLMNRSRKLINLLIRYHNTNVQNTVENTVSLKFNDLMDRNRNARCLLAIEVEHHNTRKHLMGSAINAAALGRIGIGIAWTDQVLRTFVRMRSYLNFLQRVGKPSFDTTNLIILDRMQMLQALRQAYE